MAYKVHNFGDEGIPLGSVIDDLNLVGDRSMVVAIPSGGTFSQAGLRRIRHPLRRYTARRVDAESDEDGLTVRAFDVTAALMCIRGLYMGGFDLWVDASPLYVGTFGSDGRPRGEA